MEPSPELNLIDGRNGSGKTSLLEGIHYLGTGRSFRTRRVEEVVRGGAERLVVFGEVEGPGRRRVGMGVERGGGHTRIRVDGTEARTATSLARHLPLLVMTPESRGVLWDGGEYRRRMMDWVMFHVEHSYLDVFHRYARALRQRNVLLRSGKGHAGVLDPWDAELSSAGDIILECRRRYATEVALNVRNRVNKLLEHDVSIEYVPGWDTTAGLGEALRRAREKDLERGFTTVGPHRCDLRFRVSGIPAQRRLSTGEAKILIFAWFLAQAEYMAVKNGAWPVLLVDDLGSELDRERASGFLEQLVATGAQVFISLVAREQVELPWTPSLKLFHVEQGTVREVV